MLGFLKNKIKEKDGLNSIELVIGSLVIVMLIAGLTDFINVSNRMQSVSSTMNYVSKIVSNQGCLSPNPETSYTKNGKQLYFKSYIKDERYVTPAQLYTAINTIMNSDGISSNEWRVYVDGQLLSSTTETQLFNFRDRIPIVVEVDYNWNTLANLLPINNSLLAGTFRSRQEIISTYSVRSDTSDDTGFTYGDATN